MAPFHEAKGNGPLSIRQHPLSLLRCGSQRQQHKSRTPVQKSLSLILKQGRHRDNVTRRPSFP